MAGASAEDDVNAVLDGLINPVAGVFEAFRRLVLQGEYTACELLLPGLDGAARGQAEELLQRHRQETTAELGRRWGELAARARLAAEAVRPVVPIRYAGLRRARDGFDLLSEWAGVLGVAEETLRQRLEGELAANRAERYPEWAGAVNACLKAGEFPTARALLRQGPERRPAGPAGVPRTPTWWPWDRPLRVLLDWYRDEAGAPRDFHARWLPLEADQDAWAVLEALRGLERHLDARSAEAFAGALDRFVGSERHTPRVIGDGPAFGTLLYGLSFDPHMPWLALPHALPLLISSSAELLPGTWAEGPAIWLSRDRNDRVAPRGMAVVDGQDLLRLLAPDRDRRVPGPSERRINLLRLVCRQLPYDMLLESTALVPVAREDLVWLLDLAGIQPEAVAVDVLLHDTGAQPAVLLAALEWLQPGERGPLGRGDLESWRSDPEAAAGCRKAMLAALSSDPEVGAVFLGMVWDQGQATDPGSFDSDAVLSVLETLGVTAKTPVEVEPELLNLDASLQRAARAGLLEPAGEGRYRLRRTGLVPLMTGADGEMAAVEFLLHVQQKRLRALFEPGGAHPVVRAAGHHMKGQAHGLRLVLGDLLDRTDLDPEVTSSVRTAMELVEGLEKFQEVLASGQMRMTPVDLLKVMEGQARGVQFHRHVTVAVDVRAAKPIWIAADPFVLQIPLGNLIDNAAKAVAKVGAEAPVRVRVLDGESGSVDVDIEDSGPGLPQTLRTSLSEGRPWSGWPEDAGSGRGILDSREMLRLLGGDLTLMDPLSELGGAWIRASLPRFQPAASGPEVSSEA